MGNKPNDMILDYLRNIDALTHRIEADLHDLKMSSRKQQSPMFSFNNSGPSPSTIAALEARLDRIEKRLGLTE